MYLLSKCVLRRALSVVAFTVAAVDFASAQDLSAKLPTDPKVIKGKFANGLTYYIRPNGKPENKVELRLMVKVGSIVEEDDQRGLAHFMEHMNFNGTKNFKKNELVNYLQEIGVEFGADLNAYTGFDQTVYILPIPTDKPGNLDKGFQIIEDWAHNALLTDKDIDDERGVVLEESRMGKGANMRMVDKFLPKMVAGSKYANRLPIGTDEILKTFKYERIRSYYKDWYRPDLQGVAVVGDIDSATAMAYLKKHFEGLQNPKKPRTREYVEIKNRTKPEAMVLTDKEATNSLIYTMFPYSKKKDVVTLGDYRESLKQALAQQMLNRRLNDLAQSPNPPFPFAQVSYDNMGLIHGYEGLAGITMFGEEGPEKALFALNAELLRAKEFGFTESELELAKKEMLNSVEKSYNERTTTDSKRYVDEYVRNFLENETIPGIENEYDYYKTLLPTIQASEISGLVNNWMKDMNTFTLITAPDKPEVKLPTEPELLAMAAKSYKQTVTAQEEKKVANTLMTTKPTPGKIVSKQAEADFGATTYTLSNGAKVTVKKTDFKSDEILFKGVKKGGKGQYGVNDKNNVVFGQLMNLVEEMGVGDHTPAEIEKILAGQTVSMVAQVGDISSELEGESSVKDFESMMQLAHLYVTKPRKDQALFDAFKKKMKMQLQFVAANPQAAFTDTTFKKLYNNNPLANSPLPKAEDLDKINLDRAMEIYKNEIGSADGYHFFIVGNVDEAKLETMIETYLASLPVSGKTPQIKDNGVRPVPGELKFKKGKEKQSLILSGFFGELPYSEDMGLKAQALAEIMNIKVIEELREKLGNIYSGGFSAQVEKEPYPHYTIMMYLPCGPENVDKLLAAAQVEMNNLKERGPDPKDLEKVKTQWAEKHRTNVKENSYWFNKMESVLFWERDRKTVFDYDKWMNSITAADVQQTAKQLFDNKRRFTSVLYPETFNTDGARSSN
ncbi:MAG: insulinase family protein [Flavipsychrobacter sp.]|nr:insulinase family protein [Flavipsychrobacter sp.]